MSDNHDPRPVYPPSHEEREYYAEMMRQRDEMQRRNENVPTYTGPNSMATPKVTMHSGEVDASVPAPTAPRFFAKHDSLTPTSGSSVGPDDLVEVNIPGHGPFQTSVANALGMGLITVNAGGGYRGLDASERNDIATVEQQQEQEERQQARTQLEERRATGEAADADTSRLIDIVNRAVPSSAAVSLVHDLVIHGDMSEQAIVRAASAAGWTADQGRRVAADLVQGLSNQAAVAVASQGVPWDLVMDCYEWAKQHRPVEFQHAQLEIALASDATALKRLAHSFYLNRVVKRPT